MSRGHTVGEVAKLARVSVRALHHYDEIGLLQPSGRTEAGYRLYTDGDIERLQQVLFFRELGFALEDVARILRDPHFDRRQALIAQRAMLVEKGERLKSMVALVDRTLDSLGKGIVMSTEELFDANFDAAAYDEEAKTRWGKDRGLRGVEAADEELHEGGLEEARAGGGGDHGRAGRGLRRRGGAHGRARDGSRRAASAPTSTGGFIPART